MLPIENFQINQELIKRVDKINFLSNGDTYRETLNSERRKYLYKQDKKSSKSK